MEKKDEIGKKRLEGRDEKGRFVEGEYEGGPGRPELTEQDRVIKRAQKEFAEEYKQTLAEALPRISPILVAKALKGDIWAIKEINDLVVGKAPTKTDITTAGKPIPILNINAILPNNSDREDREADQED